MTTVQHTECDSCGAILENLTEPMWILVGRINAGLRLDICVPCFGTKAPEEILDNARERGVSLGE